MIYVILLVAIPIGWILNVVKLLHAAGDPLSLLEILRVVGLFAIPFGSILGLFF
jgi:hypothetical protein